MPTHTTRDLISTLCPASVSRRKLPVNFSEDNFHLFQYAVEGTLPKSELLKFPNIRASSDGLLFKGMKILPESFAYAFELTEWKHRSIFKFLVTNYLFRRHRKIENDVLWITDYWSPGYFHWLTDALTRLFVVRDRLDQTTLLLPWIFQTREFVEPSLKVFGVKNVDFIQRDEAVQCNSLLMPTHTAPSGHFRDEVIQAVRAKLLEAYGDSRHHGSDGERIYISRQKAGRRRVVNEAEVEAILEKFGFETICTEELSLQEQVKITSRARYLVSNHGAGLTNMLFMREGSRILELRHQTDYVANCYFILSSALNFNYFYQLCQPENDRAHPHVANLRVDPNTLEQNLRLMLES